MPGLKGAPGVGTGGGCDPLGFAGMGVGVSVVMVFRQQVVAQGGQLDGQQGREQQAHHEPDSGPNRC